MSFSARMNTRILNKEVTSWNPAQDQSGKIGLCAWFRTVTDQKNMEVMCGWTRKRDRSV